MQENAFAQSQVNTGHEEKRRLINFVAVPKLQESFLNRKDCFPVSRIPTFFCDQKIIAS